MAESDAYNHHDTEVRFRHEGKEYAEARDGNADAEDLKERLQNMSDDTEEYIPASSTKHLHCQLVRSYLPIIYHSDPNFQSCICSRHEENEYPGDENDALENYEERIRSPGG